MITLGELLMGRQTFEQLTPQQQKNVMILLPRINSVRSLYGKPMKVNDGVRREQDTPPNGAKASKHLIGLAVDIDDDDTLFMWKWCLKNLDILQKVGLWLEDPRWTHGKVGTWMHFQCVPPASGKRIFVPSSAPASAPDIWDGKYDSKYDKDPTNSAKLVA
jgi:hypothetical protein